MWWNTRMRIVLRDNRENVRKANKIVCWMKYDSRWLNLQKKIWVNYNIKRNEKTMTTTPLKQTLSICSIMLVEQQQRCQHRKCSRPTFCICESEREREAINSVRTKRIVMLFGLIVFGALLKVALTIVRESREHRIISIYIILLNVNTWISSRWASFWNDLFAHYTSWSIWNGLHKHKHIYIRASAPVLHCDARMGFCSTQNVMCLNRFFMRFFLLCLIMLMWIFSCDNAQ